MTFLCSGERKRKSREKHIKVESKAMKRERDEDLKERNREEVANRSRQWETVNSDNDEEDDDSKDDNSSDKSSDSSDEEHKHKHHKKEKKHKSEKKEKKDKKDKKHKKHKKDKKEKKHSKHDEVTSSSTSAAVDQNQFGKYGIIREEHYFHKQR